MNDLAQCAAQLATRRVNYVAVYALMYALGHGNGSLVVPVVLVEATTSVHSVCDLEGDR